MVEDVDEYRPTSGPGALDRFYCKRSTSMSCRTRLYLHFSGCFVPKILALPILLRIPIVSSVLRPLTVHSCNGPGHSFYLHTFILGWTTLASWGFAKALDFHIPKYIPALILVQRVSALLIHLPSSQSTSRTPPQSQT